ncbi:3-deoxy-manno-octulosonate cytidylyltransferase (CMP-KDO synthetase) [Persephonella hydrogeniphila]|uniref:3-deoxy-manno-octulosonate cytidylyltransferase n=1 Tax=Persephonella hydrogeniphila TaxID=198703 RepID=A0A285NEI3_9AQUI|nr:3-deoxy-manno-octulosonate cytidylyltransferase [Persephonella hydrogeniphila]SNZ07859.1 3-deoxy-manno-octulosonate cytidylyltransferase (CMP-KDO synthetase) [Persephonella hydrogeniphila]
MAVIVIPARKNSKRLKNKLLLPVKGKPLIQWTAENCLKVKKAIRVIVATDADEILDIFKNSEIEAVLTPSDLKSGSDRVAYIAKELKEDKIINVQGDEPLLDPEDIDKVIDNLEEADVTTLSYPIYEEDDYLNPNVVKVVADKNGYALYFSRSPIPFYRDLDFTQMLNSFENPVMKHIGVYGYRKEVLMDFAYKLKPSIYEEIEKLEQLRLLENGYRIKVIKAKKDSLGIDTEEDYQKFCRIVA